ncbi:MAG: 50S ribosomal protein L31 [Gammaproteobacteria bacterium]|nr:50S ribosomal protein L31 [Gammaproteobacteria bacterium]
MKKNTHPDYREIAVTCSCGNTFNVYSTADHDLALDVCANCHPYYTKQQKIVDSTGRVERFKRRYAVPSTQKEKNKE